MNRFDYSLPRILSQPIPIRWAGWESDTYRLQQAGWEVSAHEDIQCAAVRLAIRHREFQQVAYTDMLRREYLQDCPDLYFEAGVHAAVKHMGHAIHVHEREPLTFHAVDAQPQFNTIERVTSLEDLAHFAVPMARTQQIIVPAETVDDLLSRILEMQEGAKKAYFEEQVGREAAAMPAHRFHAQIITLPRAS